MIGIKNLLSKVAGKNTVKIRVPKEKSTNDFMLNFMHESGYISKDKPNGNN
jgi:hypothetical protein